MLFQSLSRDSGRLNRRKWPTRVFGPTVFQSLSRDSGRLNHSVSSSSGGSTGVFQSLSRDSGRLNGGPIPRGGCPDTGFNPSVGIRGV